MIKRVKNYIGGNDDFLLDENYIINNLKDILNDKPLKYKFDITKNKKIYEVVVYNEDTKDYNPDDEPCLTIEFRTVPNGVSIIVHLLNKCIPIKNYGIFMLNSLKEFAQKFGYYSVIIGTDVSYLEFKFNDGNDIIIELAYLSILSTGESWYNKMGFYNPFNREQIEDNENKISLKISELDDSIKIIEFINDKLKYYKSLRIKKLPICYQIISSYGKFGELYNFILNITGKTETDTIQDVFKSLYKFIRENCDTDNKKCNVHHDTMQKISCFINFVYEFLDIKYDNSLLSYVVMKQKSGRKKSIKTKNNLKTRKYLKTKKY